MRKSTTVSASNLTGGPTPRGVPTRRRVLRGLRSVAIAASAVLFATTAAAWPEWVRVTADDADLARRAYASMAATDPGQPDRVYAASLNELFLSLDGGVAFSTLPALPTAESVASLAVLRLPGAPGASTLPRLP